MTLVLTWNYKRPGEKAMIWTAADTQLSNESGILSLEASKIFELPIKCKDITSPVQIEYYKSSVGFSYAGSSITAFNTYATLSTITSNLGGLAAKDTRPDWKSIIYKARDILKLYTIDRTRVAEISIWGVCPATRNSFIGAVKWDQSKGDYTLELIESEIDNLTWIALGENSAIEKLNKIIKEQMKAEFDRTKDEYWKIPYYPFRTIVQSGEFPGIGGNIQLAIVNQYKFEHLWVLVPPNDDSKFWNAKYRNMDIFEDLGRSVGDCFISINGIDMDFQHKEPRVVK